MAEKILFIIFIFRPIIDLLWDYTLFLGMNFAGLIAVFTIGITIIHLTITKKISINLISVSGFIFLVYIVIPVILFGNSYSDFAFFLRFFSAFCYFIVAAPSINKIKFEKYLMIFLIITIVPILLTYMQTLGILKYTYFDYINGIRVSRGSGGYRQPSVLTRFCIFGLLYSCYFLETKWKSKRQKAFAIIYICSNLSALFLSYHRTGYFQAVVLTFLWFLLRYRKSMYRFIKKIIPIFFIGICLFGILYVCGIFTLNLVMFKQLLSLNNIAQFEQGKFTLLLRGRGKIINYLFEGFSKNPWYNTILGNGGNVNQSSGMSIVYGDMDFIRIIWSCGFVGFILWIIHYVSVFLTIKKGKHIPDLSPVYRLSICIFVSFLIWGLTLETTATPNIISHVYLVCGYLYYEYVRKNKFKNTYKYVYKF